MAASQLSDVNYQSEFFRETLAGRFTHQLGLIQGVMQEAPENIISSNEQGHTVAIPQWKALSGDSVQITDSTTSTINAMQDFKNVGVWVEREKAWGSADVLGYIAGKDAGVALADMIGSYWAAELQKVGLNVLAGIFATALAGTHVLDDSGVTVTPERLIDAKLKLGDNANLVKYMIANSKVAGDLEKLKLLTYDTGGADTFVNGMVPRVLNMNLIQDDTLTATASVYKSYLSKEGSMVYKLRNRKGSSITNKDVFNVGGVEIELVRAGTTAGGVDQFITRVSMLVHPNGMAYAGASNPTNATLATGASWSKAANDDKLIGIVQYLSL